MSQPNDAFRVYISGGDLYTSNGECAASIEPSIKSKFWNCAMTWAIESVDSETYKFWDPVTEDIYDLQLAVAGGTSGFYGQVGIDGWMINIPGYVSPAIAFNIYYGSWDKGTMVGGGNKSWNGGDTWSWGDSVGGEGVSAVSVYVYGGSVNLSAPVNLYLFFASTGVEVPTSESDFELIAGKVVLNDVDIVGGVIGNMSLVNMVGDGGEGSWFRAYKDRLLRR
jgi:hypothetical protein